MKEPLKILHLEDSENDVKLIKEYLKNNNFNADIHVVNNRTNFLEELKNFKPDLILADFINPQYSGEEAIKDSRKLNPETPIIILTGSINEETAVKSIKAGAWEYVLKDRMFRLIPSIESAVERSRKEIKYIKDSEKAKAALKKSEEKYRSFAKQSSEGIFMFELKEPVSINLPVDEQIKKYYQVSFLEECNDAMANMYGLDSAESLIGATLEDFLPSSEKSSIDYFRKFINNNYNIINSESIEEDRSGKKKYFLNNLTGIINNDNLVRVWGVQRDVTELKQTHIALKESEEKFKSLYENSLVGIYRTTIDGKIVMANPTIVEILGYSSFEELQGRNLEKTGFGNKNERRKFIEQFKDKDKVRGLEYEWKTKDGNILYVRESSRAIRDEDGKIKYFEGTIEDVTEKKKFENKLIESEKRFQIMADTAPVMIWIAGPDKLSFYFNKPWLDFTGRSIDEELGHGWLDNVHPSDKEICLITYNNAFNNKDEFRIEYRLKRFDGEYRWIMDHGTPRILPDGTFAGFIGSCVDIHERKLGEKALIKAKEKAEESDRLKSHFLAQVSHEIRTPVNIILSYNNFIKDELERKNLLKEHYDSFNSIENASKRLMRTIDLIINMGVIQTGEFNLNYKNINLENLLSNLIEEFIPLAIDKNLELNFSNLSKNSDIQGDEYSLTQAFENIIDNAIKYTHSGKVDVKIFEDNLSKKVIIEDTGIGISENYLPKIFDPFSQEETGYTRKFEGNGLGLALTKKYIELNNADLSVKSEKNRGSVFTVTFKKLLEESSYERN